MKQSMKLFLAVIPLVSAAVITPGKASETVNSQSTCGCTVTITEYKSVQLQERQMTCPPPVTTTVYQAPPIATVVAGDPISIASSFLYASGIDSIVNQNSIQDRPTGNPPETTPIFFTHTASGPAIIATDDPNDGTVLYHFSTTTFGPVATTTVSFAPADPFVNGQGLKNSTSTGSASSSVSDPDPDHGHIVTITTYRSTVYVRPSPTATPPPSNLSITSRDLQKRQTCSMVFAELNGVWASWCNNWDGSTTVSHTTYNTTTLLTSVHGAHPVPESVYDPSHTLSKASNTVQMNPPEGPTSTSTPGVPTSTSTPEAPTSTSAPAESRSENAPWTSITDSKGPTSTSSPSPRSSPLTDISSNQASLVVTSIVVTASVVVTYPVTTITQTFSDSPPSSTSEAPAASSSCGEVGDFVITFDDLPRYSTNNPNETASPPIFDPYDHFYWSSGYGYGPPPSTPYAPHDGDRLAMYDPADDVAVDDNEAQGRNRAGSFGAGIRAWNSIFSFNAQSAFVGCNSTGSTSPCTITIEGFHWVPNVAAKASLSDGAEEPTGDQQFSVPALCASPPCPLTKIVFDPTKFSNISTLNFVAELDGTRTGFYLDSFQGSWTNNSCEAGRERQSSRK